MPDALSAATVLARIREASDLLKANQAATCRFVPIGSKHLMIQGDIDLSDLDRVPSLLFSNCVFRGALLLRRAKVASLTIEDCVFESDGAGAPPNAMIDLSDARIAGDLELLRVRVGERLAESRVLLAKRVQMGGNLRLILVKNGLPQRAVPAFSLQYASIGGEADIRGEPRPTAEETHGVVRSIDLRGANVTGNLRFADLDVRGSVHMESAVVLREVSFSRTKIAVIERSDGQLEPAVGGQFADCREGVLVEECGLNGHVDFPFSKIGGDVRFLKSSVNTPDDQGSAITLNGARLAHSFSITRTTFPSGLSMTNARVDGNVLLDFKGVLARFGTHHPWLNLAEVNIQGAFEISPNPDDVLSGEINLADAHIQRLAVFPEDLDRMKKVKVTLQGTTIARLSDLQKFEHLRSLLDAQPPAHDFQQGPWTSLIRTLRGEGNTEAARDLDIERQKRLADSEKSPLTRILLSVSNHLFQFGHGWHRAALATIVVAFFSMAVLGPVLFLHGSIRTSVPNVDPATQCLPVLGASRDHAVSQGLRFSLYGVLPMNLADRKDWVYCDGMGESAFVWLRLLGWLAAGAAGIAIGVRVRRWE